MQPLTRLSPKSLLRNNLRDLFQLLQHQQHPPRRRFLTLHDPSILPRRVPASISTHSPRGSPVLGRLRSPKHHRQIRKNTNSADSRPSPDPTPNLGSPSPGSSSSSSAADANLTLGQRLRKLTREYGWSALGVYFLLSALDFPFCFLAVRLVGTERVGQLEHIIVGAVWRVLSLDGRIGESVAEGEGKDGAVTEGLRKAGQGVEGDKGITAGAVKGGEIIEQEREGQGWNWGVEAAEHEAGKSDATIWTQLVLAYAIHKSFIFLRVPATIAVTPKVVRVLRGWGWDIGKRKPKTGTSFKTSQRTPKAGGTTNAKDVD